MSENSIMTPEWIERVWKSNPNTLLSNGKVRTGPVRTAFCHVLRRPKAKDGTERAFGTVLLFPDHRIPGVNMSVLSGPINALLKEKAPGALDNPAVRSKYHDPFKKQDSYIDVKTGELYDGFVPGRFAISANSSQSQPPVVDQRQAPVVTDEGIYSGAWVIAILSPGWIGREDKKGPTYYLDQLMVVAHDTKLGGGGPMRAQEAFEGVKVESGDINPDAAFGAGEKADAQAIDPFA